jgi:hypothetical protein
MIEVKEEVLGRPLCAPSARSRPTATRSDKCARRVKELCREVGTLLLAFAPVDYFQQEHVDTAALIAFVVLGIALVAFAGIRELRGAQ